MVSALKSKWSGFEPWLATLCCVLRQDTVTVPLSTQVYKWVLASCWGNLTNCEGVTCDGLASRPGEVEILLAASRYRNWDKLWQLWASLGSKASHTQYVCYIPLLLSQLNFLQFDIQLETRCSPPRRAFPSSCLVFPGGIRTFLAISCSDNFHKTQCRSQVAWAPGNFFSAILVFPLTSTIEGHTL